MSGIAFAVQLALALFFGAAIGAERQWRQRTAGLRTNALVSSGAAMFVLGGRLMGAPTDSVLRVAAQVVSGVGFLGGGLIFREGLVGQGPQDLALERVVSRLSLEPGVSAVTWELVGEDHAE
jgi:uncharacterized membrane protein YhiD involved in acid resistance